MNKFILHILFFIPFFSFSQADTIKVFKSSSKTFKCTTVGAYSWYLNFKDDECILADLKINPNEAQKWFDNYSNSQNIYRSKFVWNNSEYLNFKKTNDPADLLIFQVLEMSEDSIKLQIMSKNEVFVFSRFEM